MAYSKQTWENLPNQTTPITAERLNHMEDGIYEAYEHGGGGETLPVGSEIDFDGTSADIPTGWEETTDPESYSTDEVKTNKTWIDGKPIYRKVLEYSVNSTGVSTFSHNLNIDRLVKLDGLCTVAGQSVSSNGYRNIPYQVSNSEYFMVESVRTNSILFYVGTWTNNKAYVILEYTKTTD